MNQNTYTVTLDVLASKNIRFVNFIIDYIVQIVLLFGISIVINVFSELTGHHILQNVFIDNENSLFDLLSGYIILILYYLTIETLTGTSLGKFITQTKIVRHDGSKPEFTDILKRTLSRLIPFEHLSFIGKESTGWHDSISKTHVVNISKFEAKIASFDGLNEIGKIGE